MRVVVTVEKNADCGAERRMMNEQVAASKNRRCWNEAIQTHHTYLSIRLSEDHTATHTVHTPTNCV